MCVWAAARLHFLTVLPSPKKTSGGLTCRHEKFPRKMVGFTAPLAPSLHTHWGSSTSKELAVAPR